MITANDDDIFYVNHDRDYSSSSSSTEAIELISLSKIKYTSLRDIISSLPSPPRPEDDDDDSDPSSHSSSLLCRKGSWREVHIKDSLVKHAAIAYLQPLPEGYYGGGGGWRGWIEWWCGGGRRRGRDRVGLLGCFEFVSDVVLGRARGWMERVFGLRGGLVGPKFKAHVK
ncbi:hypothetical protein Droror1_Dr00007132 [Drosera rotundifolia]